MRNLPFFFALLSFSPVMARGALPVELLYTAPVETNLAIPSLRDAASAWPELFDSARKTIDIGQMYASGQPGEQPGDPLGASIEALERAGKRGVKIRMTLEKKMSNASTPETVERLKKIPNLELKVYEFAKLNPEGIVHAKYFVIDRKVGFLGSQNFDWRALKHIHELGVKISDPKIAAQMEEIFERDWREDAKASPRKLSPDSSKSVYLVASPGALNPPDVGDSEEELARLIGSAREEIRVQVMNYTPMNFKQTQFYPVIDNALRDAAVRGVKIKLLVSDWNLKPAEVDHLKSLIALPQIEIRVVSIPDASQGFIPYARVIHSKYMVIDGKLLWVGTSNWAGGYLDKSRNLELVVRDAGLASQGREIHEKLWNSPYAQALDFNKKYSPRRQK